MPQPNTHYLLIEEALKGQPNSIWQNKPYTDNPEIKCSNFAGFGSFGPDLFYVLGVPHVPNLLRKYPKDYTLVSDIMHWEASLDFFCCMLDYIKNRIKDTNKETIDKLKAFAYGYYSHVVTDAVFHPFIYRRTGDNWAKHVKFQYNKHKHLESLIDAYLLGRIKEKNPHTFDYQKKVECHKQGSGRTLDQDVHELFHHSIRKIYGERNIFGQNGIDYEKHFGHGVTDAVREGRHPILEAYRDYISAFRSLYVIGGFIPPRFHPLVPIVSLNSEQLHEVDPIPKRKWYPSNDPLIPNYSIQELFDFGVRAMRMVIDASERFFSRDATNSREFFSQHAQNVVFLDENYNFDMGLPSRFNEELRRISADLKILFNWGLDILDRNYRTIDAYVV